LRVTQSGAAQPGPDDITGCTCVPQHHEPHDPAPTMSYLGVLKAAYDYEPQGADEIAVRENALLFLLERTDDECVRAG
jgi:hypothetical protein